MKSHKKLMMGEKKNRTGLINKALTLTIHINVLNVRNGIAQIHDPWCGCKLPNQTKPKHFLLMKLKLSNMQFVHLFFVFVHQRLCHAFLACQRGLRETECGFCSNFFLNNVSTANAKDKCRIKIKAFPTWNC